MEEATIAEPTLDEVAEEVVAAEPVEETPAEGDSSGEEAVAAPEEEAGRVVTDDANEKINRKIAKHKREARAKAEEAEYWRKQALEGKTGTKPNEPAEPTPDQFNDYEDYIIAKAQFTADKRFEEKQRLAQAQAAANAHTHKVNSIISKGNAEYDDFDELTRAIPLTEYSLAAATETENGSDVVYFLGKNPGEAERIANLSPVAQVIEIGKISSKLAAPPKKVASKAPEPIKPVSTAGKGDLQYRPDMTDAEYAAWRNQHRK